MRAGALRDRVRFERQGGENSGYVSGATAWATLATARAEIKALSSTREDETVIADRLAGVSAFEIRVRYTDQTASLTAADRVVDVRTGRVMNITHVAQPDRRNRAIVVTAVLGKSAIDLTSRQESTLTAAIELATLQTSATLGTKRALYGSATIPALTASSDIVVTRQLSASATLPAPTLSAEITSQAGLRAVINLPGLTASATASAVRQINAGGIVMPGLTALSTATAQRVLDGTITLPGLLMTGRARTGVIEAYTGASLARDIVVDPDTGDDTNDGSPGAPFATITRLSEYLFDLAPSAAPVCWIKAATYRRQGIFNQAGDEYAGSAVLVFEPGAIIDGEDLTEHAINVSGQDAATLTVYGNGLTIDNFMIGSANGFGCNHCTMRVYDAFVRRCSDGVSAHGRGHMDAYRLDVRDCDTAIVNVNESTSYNEDCVYQSASGASILADMEVLDVHQFVRCQFTTTANGNEKVARFGPQCTLTACQLGDASFGLNLQSENTTPFQMIDCAVYGFIDGQYSMTLDRCYGMVWHRLRSGGGGITHRDCVYTANTAIAADPFMNFANLGASQMTIQRTVVRGYPHVLDLNSADGVTAWNSANSAITDCQMFGSSLSDFDSFALTAAGITGTSTSDPQLSAAAIGHTSLIQADWVPNAPVGGAGFIASEAVNDNTFQPPGDWLFATVNAAMTLPSPTLSSEISKPPGLSAVVVLPALVATSEIARKPTLEGSSILPALVASGEISSGNAFDALIAEWNGQGETTYIWDFTDPSLMAVNEDGSGGVPSINGAFRRMLDANQSVVADIAGSGINATLRQTSGIHHGEFGGFPARFEFPDIAANYVIMRAFVRTGFNNFHPVMENESAQAYQIRVQTGPSWNTGGPSFANSSNTYVAAAANPATDAPSSALTLDTFETHRFKRSNNTAGAVFDLMGRDLSARRMIITTATPTLAQEQILVDHIESHAFA